MQIRLSKLYSERYRSYMDVKELTPAFIDAVLNDKRQIILEYSYRPSVAYWKELNEKVLAVKSNVRLRLFTLGAFGIWKNLSFLKHLDNLKGLNIQDVDLTDLSPLTYVKDLVSFSLSETISRAVSLRPLEKFTNLENLMIAGYKKDSEVIEKFEKLKRLSIGASKASSLEFIGHKKDLQFLLVSGGAITDLSFLKNFSALAYLQLESLNKLTSLDFIPDLPSLTYLYLRKVKNITSFPDLEPCQSLKKIQLEFMNGIRDLSQLKTCKTLEEFDLTTHQKYTLDDFRFLCKMPAMHYVSINCLFGKTYEEFERLMESSYIDVGVGPWGRHEHFRYW